MSEKPIKYEAKCPCGGSCLKSTHKKLLMDLLNKDGLVISCTKCGYRQTIENIKKLCPR